MLDHIPSSLAESIASAPNPPLPLDTRATLGADRADHVPLLRKGEWSYHKTARESNTVQGSQRIGDLGVARYAPTGTKSRPRDLTYPGCPHTYPIRSACIDVAAQCGEPDTQEFTVSLGNKNDKTNPIAPLLATPKSKNKPNQTQFIGFQNACRGQQPKHPAERPALGSSLPVVRGR